MTGIFIINREKNKVGSLAVIAILLRDYLRPITLRPILLDSLPFTTFYICYLYSLLLYYSLIWKILDKMVKNLIKWFLIQRLSNLSIPKKR